jgi:hypothetical protein
MSFISAAKDKSFLNLQLWQQVCHTIPILHKSISSSTAKNKLQKLHAKQGIAYKGITDKQCCGSGSTGSTCFWASMIRIQIH